MKLAIVSFCWQGICVACVGVDKTWQVYWSQRNSQYTSQGQRPPHSLSIFVTDTDISINMLFQFISPRGKSTNWAENSYIMVVSEDFIYSCFR